MGDPLPGEGELEPGVEAQPQAGAWYVRLVDPFGNQAYCQLPASTAERFFKGTVNGPFFSAL